MEFLEEELQPNRNLGENLRSFLLDIEKLVPACAFKKISKALTEKAINNIKEKIKTSQQEIVKRLQREGVQIPPYSKRDDENCMFKGAVGKYIKGKQIPLIVQQQLLGVISKDEQSTFNHIYIDYVKSKRVFASLDERFLKQAQSQKLLYDHNDCPLSK